VIPYRQNGGIYLILSEVDSCLTIISYSTKMAYQLPNQFKGMALL
jgi:hypothetical protein